MWTAIGTIGATVLKEVVEHALNPNDPNKSAGTSNHRPDPLQSDFQHQFHSSPQTPPRYPQAPPACSNCRNCSKQPATTRNNKKNYRNQKNESSVYTIKVAKNSDLEVKIKNTQSQMAQMNINVKNNVQKAASSGNNNLKGQQGFRKPKLSTVNDNNNIKKEKILKSSKTNNLGDNKFKTHNNVKPRNDRKSEATNGGSTWMYLGRLKIGTTEGDIHSYLTEKFRGRKFKVESLPLYKDGKLPCFKVLVDNSILSEFQELGHWPEGVKIGKYYHNFKK